MIITRIAIAAALTALAIPALAADFYLVQDVASGRCSVVEERPSTESMVLVGDGELYRTKAEAEAAMKKFFVCMSAPTDTATPPATRQ